MLVCRQLPEKIGDLLSEEQYAMVEELGLLVDKDDQVQAPMLVDFLQRLSSVWEHAFQLRPHPSDVVSL